jgi:hypothetical protein
MDCSKGLAAALGLTLAFGAPALKAEDDASQRFGAQLVIATPRSDLARMIPNTGTGGALFVEQNLNEDTIIQTRFQYVAFGKAQNLTGFSGNAYLPPSPLSLTADATALAVEVRHFLPVTTFRHVYVLAGLSGMRYELRSTFQGTAVDANGITVAGVQESKLKSSTKLAVTVGLGLDFDRTWGLGMRYTHMPIDGTTLGSLETNLSVRF